MNDEEIKSLPIFAEAVAAIVAKVPTLVFKPWWTYEYFDGLRFGIEGDPEPQKGAVWASPRSTDCTLEGMGRSILYKADLSEWVRRVQACTDVPEEGGMAGLNMSVTVSKALLTECLKRDEVALVARSLLEQAQRALEDGTVLKHNKYVASRKLAMPLFEALQNGMTVADITSVATEIAKQDLRKKGIRELLQILTKSLKAQKEG